MLVLCRTRAQSSVGWFYTLSTYSLLPSPYGDKMCTGIGLSASLLVVVALSVLKTRVIPSLVDLVQIAFVTSEFENLVVS